MGVLKSVHLLPFSALNRDDEVTIIDNHAVSGRRAAIVSTVA